jgi:hypothetical protein
LPSHDKKALNRAGWNHAGEHEVQKCSGQLVPPIKSASYAELHAPHDYELRAAELSVVQLERFGYVLLQFRYLPGDEREFVACERRVP